jgi:hypothetical protein
MASYVNLPTLPVDYLGPMRWMFGVQGSAMEGGRSGLGDAISIETTGGGRVICEFDFWIGEDEQHEILNWLSARCDGGFRFVNVPIPTDFVGPFTGGVPIVSGIPHSDGALFSDGAGYSQATVFATFAASAALNAGVIKINVFGASRNLRWSDWMSTYHSTKGWRAWRYWSASDPVAVTESVDGVSYDGLQYDLRISPPLREAVALGQRIEIARPRFAARFPAGFSLKWEVRPGFIATPTVPFVEAR